VRVRNVLLLGLVIVLAVGAIAVVGCGSSQEDAKATLSAALDKVEASVAKFQQLGASSTIADVKAARDAVGADWGEVVTAAKAVKGADAAGAEAAWTAVDKAITAIPDDASIAAAAGIMGPVQALMQVEASLRTLVSPSK
jgi:hypothetical protein